MSIRHDVCACCVAIARRRIRCLATFAPANARFSLEERKHAAPPRKRSVRPQLPAAVSRAPQQDLTIRQEPIDPSSLPWKAYNEVENAKSSSAVIPFQESTTPVIVPDDPQGLIQTDSGAARILSQSALIVVRQMEFLNVFIGFEQASRFAITSPTGEALGYLLEEGTGVMSAVGRQLMRQRRPFKATVMDTQGNVVLRIRRPLSIINTRITVTAGPEDPAISSEPVPILGESRQIWSPFRRKYELFDKAREGEDEDAFQQFGYLDSPFLAWEFDCLDAENKVCASISRRWAGWGRELFTDTGQYVLRFDAVRDDAATKLLTAGTTDTSRATQNQYLQAVDKASNASDEEREKALVLAQERTTQGLTLDQRAVLLACAVSIDVDYFSRSRGGPGSDMMLLPFLGGWGGDSAATEAGTADSPIQGGDIEGDTDPSGSIGNSPYPGDEDARAPDPPSPAPSDELPEGYQEELGEEPVFRDPWGSDPGDKWSPGGQQNQGGNDDWWSGGSSGSGGGDSGGSSWGDWGGGGDW